MANKLINNYGGDTQVSKEIKKRCFNWFEAAFIAEERDDQSLARIADNMLAMLGGQARRKDAIRIALYHYQNGVCNLCGQPFPIQIFHIDHIEAKTRNQNNKLSNLQVLCSACNSWKSDRPMHKVRDLRRKAELTIYEPRYYFEKDQSKPHYDVAPKPIKKVSVKVDGNAQSNGNGSGYVGSFIPKSKLAKASTKVLKSFPNKEVNAQEIEAILMTTSPELCEGAHTSATITNRLMTLLNAYKDSGQTAPYKTIKRGGRRLFVWTGDENESA